MSAMRKTIIMSGLLCGAIAFIYGLNSALNSPAQSNMRADIAFQNKNLNAITNILSNGKIASLAALEKKNHQSTESNTSNENVQRVDYSDIEKILFNNSDFTDETERKQAQFDQLMELISVETQSDRIILILENIWRLGAEINDTSGLEAVLDHALLSENSQISDLAAKIQNDIYNPDHVNRQYAASDSEQAPTTIIENGLAVYEDVATVNSNSVDIDALLARTDTEQDALNLSGSLITSAPQSALQIVQHILNTSRDKNSRMQAVGLLKAMLGRDFDEEIHQTLDTLKLDYDPDIAALVF